MASDSDAIAVAAARIASADFILVAAGAGFSADSGLPVYNDIASVKAYHDRGLEYHDLCDPYCLEEDAPTFFGFWGHCFDTYRDTNPHVGYDILCKWKTQLRPMEERFRRTFDQLRLTQAIPAGVTQAAVTNQGFFVYTSNVDGHFLRKVSSNEVYELHGSLEQWQCAGSVDTPRREPCSDVLLRLEPSFRFNVDSDTMQVDGASTIGVCPSCHGPVRPNVLMFHDKNWIANTDDEDRYVAWEAVMEQMLEDDPSLKLVVLEVGCGMRVPSVRKETEMVVADIDTRCLARDHVDNRSSEPQVTLIRINPDYPECEHPALQARRLVVSIRSTALTALKAIDALISGKPRS